MPHMRRLRAYALASTWSVSQSATRSDQSRRLKITSPKEMSPWPSRNDSNNVVVNTPAGSAGGVQSNLEKFSLIAVLSLDALQAKAY